MQTQSEADPFATSGVLLLMRGNEWTVRWRAALLATLAMLVIWKIVSVTPYVDDDTFHLSRFCWRLYIFVAWANTM